MSMNSFSSLNSLGTIAYTDNRRPDVIFTWPAARNIPTITKTSNVFNVERKIDIAEIIDANYTNIKYIIDLSAVEGATLTWNYLPGGSVTTSTGNVYTVQPITTVAEWNSIAAPTITLPVDFQGSFFYTASIQYTTNEGVQTVSWTVGSYVPVSDMTAVSTVVTSPTKYKGIVNEEFETIFTLNGVGYDYISFEAALAAQGSFVSTAVKTARTTIPLSSIISTTIQGTQNGRLAGNLSAISSVSASVTEIVSVQNSSINRQYITNWYSYPFNAVPYVNFDYFYGTVSEYKVVISTGGGYLYSEDCEELNPGSTATIITSTKAALEAAIKGLRYYSPSYGYTSNVGYQLRFYADGTLIHTGTVAYFTSGSTDNRVSTGVFSTRTQNSWYPTLEEQLYCNRVDIRFIGAGGGGANFDAGGGGASGDMISRLSQTFNNNVYVQYLSGGNGGAWGAGGSNWGANGSSAIWNYYDSSNTLDQITVTGGQGAGYPGGTVGIDDGGSNSSYSGGQGLIVSVLNRGGGGGAGVSGNGSNAYQSGSTTYGGGGGNGITFNTVVYGRGGGGAQKQDGSQTDPVGSGFDYNIGTGGFGGPTNFAGYKGNGAPSGILIKTYRV